MSNLQRSASMPVSVSERLENTIGSQETIVEKAKQVYIHVYVYQSFNSLKFHYYIINNILYD